MTGNALERLLLAALGSAATAGVLGTGYLVAHATVPDWLLPLALLAGLGAAFAVRPVSPPPATLAAAPRWLTALALLLLATLTALLVHGALATPSRHWDGAVAWDLKANVLAAAPTLEQPFFRDPAVYCHSRDYPLLQPLLMALLDRCHVPGRLLFAAGYLLLVTTVAVAARAAATHDGRWRVLLVLAAAVTPMWLSPTGGSFDSGYGDALLTTWLAAAALGAALANGPMLGLALVLVCLQKPEGLPYAGLLLAALWLRGDARGLRTATAAVLLGGALVLLLQGDLRSFGSAAIAPLPAVLGFAAALALLGLDAWLRRRGAQPRARWLWLLLLAPLGIGAYLLANGGDDGLVGAHLADAGRPWQRLDRLPRLLPAIAEWAWGRGAFGLTFVVPVALALAQWRTRSAARAPVVWLWLLLAVPLWCVPFLTSPLDDLERHLRATLPRVMLHWTGTVWVWIALQTFPGRRAEPALGSRTPTS